MMFSTKSEYGVRLLVELGRSYGSKPVALAEVARKENLPLAYLEHVVARLRRAGLVESQRGAHGGYRLSKRPDQINMAEAVRALEGNIAPMECFVKPGPGGKVLCSHELDGDRNCSTKLLWTRVLEGVLSSLHNTKLSELVEFADADSKSLAA